MCILSQNLFYFLGDSFVLNKDSRCELSPRFASIRQAGMTDEKEKCKDGFFKQQFTL
jgi:hypothetical protein